MALATSPGDLRERVRIDQPASVPDGMGGSADSWLAFTTCWAKVTPPPALGAEQLESGGLAAVSLYRFTIRRRLDLKPTFRLAWPVDPFTGDNLSGTALFNIRGIALGPSNELYMALDAEAGVAQ